MNRFGGTFALRLFQYAQLHEPLTNPTTLPWRHPFSSWRLRNIYGQAGCSPPWPHLGPHRPNKQPGDGGPATQTCWRARPVSVGQGPPHASPHGPHDTNSKNHHPPRWHGGLYRYLPLSGKQQTRVDPKSAPEPQTPAIWRYRLPLRHRSGRTCVGWSATVMAGCPCEGAKSGQSWHRCARKLRSTAAQFRAAANVDPLPWGPNADVSHPHFEGRNPSRNGRHSVPREEPSGLHANGSKWTTFLGARGH